MHPHHARAIALALVVVVVVVASSASRAAPVPAPTAAPSPPLGSPARPASVVEAQPAGRLPVDVHPTKQSLSLVVDPRATRFSGQTQIALKLDRARRTLWLHARRVDVNTASVVTSAGRRIEGRVTITDEDGLASVHLPEPIGPGDVTLELAFDAAFHHDNDALYTVDVDGKAYAFTQFEALSAREAFPCFDEPSFKIPFVVDITAPIGMRAVANSTIVEDAPVDAQTHRVRFTPTRPLPSYLVAFAVGDLDVVDGPTLPPRLERTSPLTVRGLAVAGRAAQMRWSLAFAARSLDVLEQMLGIAYPYDKLDLVAVPDFAAGAMENAGLVTFRDSRILVDSNNSIAAQKAAAYTIAHELAHQWFGDLVTMAWWDDLWLNEGFATWMEARAMQRIRPDFDGAMDLRESASYAASVDSLDSARQVHQPIRGRGDILTAFDGITYSKGAAVLAMFEEWVDREKGEGAFLRAVSAYVAAHRDRVGTTDAFARTLDEQTGLDVASRLRSFVDQAGIPVVTQGLECEKGRAMLSLSQARYLPAGSNGTRTRLWRIPVCVRFDDDGKAATTCTTIDDDEVQWIELPTHTCPRWVHPNADGGGYYRFTSSTRALHALATSRAMLTAGERLALADAIRAAWMAPTVDPAHPSMATDAAQLIDIAALLVDDEEPEVAGLAHELLQHARHELATTTAQRGAIDRRIVKLYAPALLRMGLRDKKEDPPRVRELRAALFSFVVDVDTGGGRAQQVARDAGRELWANGQTDRIAIGLWPAAMRSHVRDLHDVPTWEELVQRFKREQAPERRSWMLRALSSVRDPALADRALRLPFDDTLRVNERLVPLRVQSSDVQTQQAAWRFVREHHDELRARLDEESAAGFPAYAEGGCSSDDEEQVRAFFTPRVSSTPGLDRELASALEEIHLCGARRVVLLPTATTLLR